MKTEIVENKKTQRLPEVGEAWTHPGSADVYVRINDKEGRRALDFEAPDDKILYSISLCSGRVLTTDKTATCTILEPVGGVMRFQAKEIAP